MSRLITVKELGKGCPTWAALTELDGFTRELKILAASSEESPIPARKKVNALIPPQAAGNARQEFKN